MRHRPKRVEIRNLHICVPNVPVFSSKGHSCNIDNLPVEILSRIFEFGGGSCEDEDSEFEGKGITKHWDRMRFYPLERRNEKGAFNGRIHVNEIDRASDKNRRTPSFRVSISLVCRLWNQVVISTPSLWTTIDLSYWFSEYRFERLQTILARTRGLSLDVEIYHYTETEPPEIDSDRLKYGLLALPCLEKQYISFFRGLLPRLRTMRLSQCRLKWSQPWKSSLSNLTTLELNDPDEGVRPSWNQLLSMLRSAASLKTLVLQSTTSDDVAGELDAPVALLNLTDLVLGEERPECVEGLLFKLYLPSLKRLSLDLDCLDYSDFIQLLAGPATLPTAYPGAEKQHSLLSQLEHLRIASLSWGNNRTTLEMLYDGLHNLTLLQIALSAFDETPRYLELLHLLLPHKPAGQESVAVRLPRLETLIVCRFVGTLTQIREVVDRRKDAGFPLKNLHIQKSDNKDLQWLGDNLDTFSLFYGGYN